MISVATVALFVISGWAVVVTAAPGGMASGTTSTIMVPDLVVGGQTHALSEICSASGLCPVDVRTAYGFNTLEKSSTKDGTGQVIVIVDACGDPKIKSDVSTFDSVNHLPTFTLSIVKVQGSVCSNSGWALETSLDVEWGHAMAPGAAIVLLETASPTSTDLYGAWTYSLSHSLGDQISNSWGGSGACGSSTSGILNKAATAGVTVLASAGDNGAWGSGQALLAQSPADCQKVTAVGGTTLNVNAKGDYISESAWDGTGGGYRPKSTEPPYQLSPGITDSYKELAKPDVAAVANPNTGVWVYNAGYGGWLVVGGTSVSCPLWAAFLADANGWRISNGFGALGSLNPYFYLTLYGTGGSSAWYPKDFHDVTSGNNGWPAGTGWDADTGLGTFQAGPLAKQLATDPSA